VDSTRELPAREHGLDALRVFAFGLLIVYHSCLAYVSWPWVINDPGGGRALEPVLVAINRWRLPLLFFVSGAAATLSLRRRTWLEFAHERAQRLFLPLGVGVLLVCPPRPGSSGSSTAARSPTWSSTDRSWSRPPRAP
jgi:hypothetical protein